MSDCEIRASASRGLLKGKERERSGAEASSGQIVGFEAMLAG